MSPKNVSKTAAELGGSRGTLRTLVYLATYCAFERIDELACVAALLAILLLENSSPVHPASLRPGILFWIREGTLGLRLFE